jgi:hypothetical protein
MDEKKPRIEVECSTAEGSGGRHFRHHADLLEFRVVTLGCIVRDEVNEDAN